MDFLIQFINEYGTAILYAIITAIAGYIGIVLKNAVEKYLNTKTKRDVAKSVVQFVNQVYKDIHGEEKLNEAMKAFSEILAEKGISITELEMKVLLESAVREINDKLSKVADVTDGTKYAEISPEISE